MIKNFSLVFLLLLSACATMRPVKSGRIGLLDRSPITGNKFTKVEGASMLDQADDVADIRDSLKDLPGEWDWPLKNVTVSSPFGKRGRKFHEGVDLRANVGTPVYAAGSGKVIYSGSRIRGYGRMIVIQHDGGFYSIYAHHSKNNVKIGQSVKTGQLIAMSGRSGRVHGPHLHFEIRKGTVSLDPVPLMNTERKLASLKGRRSPSSF